MVLQPRCFVCLGQFGKGGFWNGYVSLNDKRRQVVQVFGTWSWNALATDGGIYITRRKVNWIRTNLGLTIHLRGVASNSKYSVNTLCNAAILFYFSYERNWIAGLQLISKTPFFLPSLHETAHTNDQCFQAKNKRTGQDVALKAMCKWVNSDMAMTWEILTIQNSKPKIWCRNKTKNMLILKGKTENRIAVVHDMKVIIVALEVTRRDVTNTALGSSWPKHFFR